MSIKASIWPAGPRPGVTTVRSRRRQAGFWARAEHRLDGVSPGFFVDALNNRHMLAGRRCALSDLLTLTNGSANLTYVAADGTVKTAAPNVPRIDYSTGAAALLLEGAANNYLQRSHAIGASPWAVNGSAEAVAGTTVTTAPDGTNTATLIVASGLQHGLYQPLAVTSGAKRVWSVYLKPGNGVGNILVGIANNPGTARLVLNTADMSIASVGAGIEAYGRIALANGWVRVWGAYTSTGTDNTLIIYSNEASTEKRWYAWGAQNEAGVVVSSLIRTINTAVTRPADLCTLTPAVIAVLSGTGAALAYRGRAEAPAGQPGPQVIIGQGANLGLLRAGAGTPSDLLLDGGGTNTLIVGPGAIPGELRTAIGWGPAGKIGSNNGGVPVAHASAMTSALTPLTLGRTWGVDTFSVHRISQLVGWSLPARPSAAGIQSQARAAA